jgi:putative membrane protein
MRMTITDHGQMQNQLLSLANNWGVYLSNETDQEHKDMKAMLMALIGRSFDSTYIYMMVSGHDKAIALFQEEIDNGRSETLKSVVNATCQN